MALGISARRHWSQVDLEINFAIFLLPHLRSLLLWFSEISWLIVCSYASSISSQTLYKICLFLSHYKIALGFTVQCFILEYVIYSKTLRFLFQSTSSTHIKSIILTINNKQWKENMKEIGKQNKKRKHILKLLR